MTTHDNHPPYRSLDIYRLVVTRNQRQHDVANAFGVHPSRICQVIRRVRDWVNDSIGDWLFPGRDDLRFLVALEFENIRLTESESNPHSITIQGPRCRYTRQLSDATAGLPSSACRLTTQLSPLNMSAHPLNSRAQLNPAPLAATSNPTTTSPTPDITELASRIAQLLILWKKTRPINAALRPIRRRSK